MGMRSLRVWCVIDRYVPYSSPGVRSTGGKTRVWVEGGGGGEKALRDTF